MNSSMIWRNLKIISWNQFTLKTKVDFTEELKWSLFNFYVKMTEKAMCVTIFVFSLTKFFECWIIYKGVWNFQIALAAVIHGASKSGFNLDAYVTEVLFGVSSQSDEEQHAKKQSTIHTIIEAVRSNLISSLISLQHTNLNIFHYRCQGNGEKYSSKYQR